MKFRNTIILLVVFGALLAYFYLLEKDNNPTPLAGTPTATSVNVFTFASKDVVELNLTDGTKSTDMKRDSDTAPWQIVAPTQSEADSVRVNSAVEQLSTLTASRVFTDAESTGDLAPFGLSKPTLDVTAKLKDGTAYVLHVGDKTPENVNVYVQKGDDKAIYLVSSTMPDDVLSMLDTPPLKPTPTATSTPTETPTVTATVEVTATIPVTGTPVTPATAPITATEAISSTPAATATATTVPTATAASPTVTTAATTEATATPLPATSTPTTVPATATPPAVPATSAPAITPTVVLTPTAGMTATP